MKTRALAAFATFLALTAYGATSDAPEERFEYSSVPAGFHRTVKPQVGLILGGLAVFAAGYVPTVALGFLPDAQKGLGFVPILGPVFVTIDWFARDQTYEFLGAFVVMASVVNVVAQVAGVLMIIRGISSPQRRLLRWARAWSGPSECSWYRPAHEHRPHQ